MRILIALPDYGAAEAIRDELELQGMNAAIARSGTDTMRRLSQERFDLLLLHSCLSEADGFFVGEWLNSQRFPAPPKIVFITPADCCPKRPRWADAVVEAGVSVRSLCRLLEIAIKKPLPALAAAQRAEIHTAVNAMLDQLAMDRRLKGHTYAAWMLERMLLSPVLQEWPLEQLYESCAAAHQVRSSAVERCIRTAVESVFTQGSLPGIERIFGATVDPEKGKPTNRAFLWQAADELRRVYSRTDTRSLNRSVMHHSPAAPTSV